MFSENIPLALRTSCVNCTDLQKKFIRKSSRFIMTQRPDDWELIVRKFDPEGVYKEGFYKFLDGDWSAKSWTWESWWRTGVPAFNKLHKVTLDYYRLTVWYFCMNKIWDFIINKKFSVINTFKYHVSYTNGKISVRIILLFYLFFHRRPIQNLCISSL